MNEVVVACDGQEAIDYLTSTGRAFLFVTGISDGSCLAVVAQAGCDVGLVGYEMAVLVEKCASALTPGLISELQTALPRSAIR